MRNFILLFVSLSLACGDTSRTCYPSDGIEEGTASLSLDGVSLTYDATWLMTGSSLQLNLDHDGSALTIRLSQSADGSSIDALGESSAEFSLGNPENGTATFYPSDSASSATIAADNPGSFTLSSFDQNTLTGCFSFIAEAQDGTSYEISTGLVNATESELNQ